MSEKIKMYLNAIKCIFPYDNKVFSKLISHARNKTGLISQTSQNSLIETNNNIEFENKLLYIWNKIKKEELNIIGLTNDQIDKFFFTKKSINPKYEYDLLLANKISLISQNNSDYPELLKSLYSPPEILYVQGDKSLLINQNISIVGSRTPTSYGKEMTSRIIRDLSRYNFTIVSGLAIGIDTLSHKEAISNNLKTIAVLGSGHNFLYTHSNLVKEMLKKHAIISEYPFNTPATRYTFPQRNRIISGLSLATVVVEAKEKSGSLITANFARDQGREVFAVPGSLLNACSRGTNGLLIDPNANIYINADTMVQRLNLLNTFPIFNFKKDNIFLQKTPLAKSVYLYLSQQRSINEILDKFSSSILPLLTELEMRNYIVCIAGQNWIQA